MSTPLVRTPVAEFIARFAAFVLERHPLGLSVALEALETSIEGTTPVDANAIERLRPRLKTELQRRLGARPLFEAHGTTPGYSSAARLTQAVTDIVEACDGFLRRAS